MQGFDNSIPVRRPYAGRDRVRTESAEPSSGTNGESVNVEFEATARLEATADGSYLLRLVDAPNGTALADIDTRFAGAFAELRERKAPLRIDYDVRPRVPRLSWPLNKGPLQLGERAGGDDWSLWEVHLGSDVYRARLETAASGYAREPAVAHLRAGNVKLVKKPEGVEFSYEVSADRGEPQPPLCECASAEYRTLDSASHFALHAVRLARGKEAMVRAIVPLADEADRLGARYAARGLLAPGVKRSPYLFLPIEDGVAQLATPEPAPTRKDVNVSTNRPRRGALVGGAVWRWDKAVLEVDDAASATVEVKWCSGEPSTVRISLQAPQGAVRNLLWLAEESPDSAETTPTGRRSPAASRPMPIYFGSADKSTGDGVWCAFSAEENNAGWRARIAIPPQASPQALLWRRHPRLPLITAAPMTTSTASSSQPSTTRGLIVTAASGRIIVKGSSAGGLPRLEKLDPEPEAFSWPIPDTCDGKPLWGSKAVALLAPTLPGVEFTHESTATLGFTLKTALRYDLPALDEFFAGVNPPGPAPKSATVAVPPTALQPERLRDELWHARARALSLTRTQAARCERLGRTVRRLYPSSCGTLHLVGQLPLR